MANTYASEVAGLGTTPVGNADGAVQGGRVRRFRASITLAEQADGDTITLASVPAGYAFAYGVITTSASLGSAEVSVGVLGTPAKYKALATLTDTDTPALFGVTSGIDDDVLTASEVVILTVDAAALPASGTMVVDLFFSAP